MAQLPIIMGPQGPIPTSPATLRQQLITLVSSTNPGYTANLPASLIEDVSSTDVGAIVISNQMMIDLINSVTPYGANQFILNQLGIEIYGIQPESATNTAVDLIFFGVPGFIIIPGFVVGDQSFQYICADGGVINTNGQSLPIHAIATLPGTWAVPAGSVNTIVTSVPSNMNLSVINPTDGIPSIGTEDVSSFRTRTLVAGLAASTGMDRYLKTLLWNVPGVVQRLVSVRQNLDTGRWIILCGGGDPYQVAWCIYYALFDIQTLERTPIQIFNITNTDPILVTTVDNHNLTTGMVEKFTGITGGMIALNEQQFPVSVLGPNTLSIPVDGTQMPYYAGGGGIITPNPILQEIFLNSYPDSYLIPFLLPAQQLVTIVLVWDTDSPNYVSSSAISQAASPAIINYINSLYVGVAPVNLYEMQALFVDAIADILPAENLTVINFTISWDNITQEAVPGTGVIYGDPNSYFYTTANNVFVNQLTP
jgi:ubiquitin-activating enzyme E1-like protein